MEKDSMKKTAKIIASLLVAFICAVGLLGCAGLQERPQEKGNTVFKDTKDTPIGAQVHRTERVAAHRLNLRQGPSTKATILAVLNKGDLLKIQSEKGTWLNVITSKGTKGWVYNRYVTGYGALQKEDEQQISSPTSGDSGGRQGPLIQPDQTVRGQEKAEKKVPDETSQDEVKTEPLFEDDPIAETEQTFPSSEDPDLLFEDEEPAKNTERLETGSVDPASPQQPEPLIDRSTGPWGNAKLGTTIRYQIWKTVGTFEVKRIPVSITEEVIAVDDLTVVLKGRREWHDNGDLKSNERQFKRLRFLPSDDLKMWMAKHGEKTGTEVLQIGDHTIHCEIYTLVEEEEIQTFSGETKKVGRTKIFHLSKAVPGWRVRLQVKSEQGDEIKWRLLEFKP
jgi:hypothetical protein